METTTGKKIQSVMEYFSVSESCQTFGIDEIVDYAEYVSLEQNKALIEQTTSQKQTIERLEERIEDLIHGFKNLKCGYEMVLAENRLKDDGDFIKEAEHLLNTTEPTNKIIDNMDAPDGLYGKYIIKRADGKPIEPENEYFVLKLAGKGDKRHMDACRKAILVYAEEMRKELPELSNDIFRRYDY